MPTAIPTDNYLQQRSKAISALLKVYKPAIADLKKAKKLDEAMALEKSLDEILVANRGYGVAFPDLDMKPAPVFLIENKSTGQVIDTANTIKEGSGDLVVSSKVGKSKPSQCWQLEREGKGFLIRNFKSGDYFVIFNKSREAGKVITTFRIDRSKDIQDEYVFRMISQFHDITIEPSVNDLALSLTEKKVKGVTITSITQEKKESPPAASQVWTLVELK